MIIVGCEDGGGAGRRLTRRFEHLAGITEIPLQPQRIVALHDQQVLLPLLELGVRPVGSVGAKLPDGSTVFRRTEIYDTGGIAFVGPYGEPDLELVALQRPDLIIGGAGDTRSFAKLSRIAPAVLLKFTEGSLVNTLRPLADVAGALDRWTERKDAYAAAIEDLRHHLPRPPGEITVSIVQFEASGFNVSVFWSSLRTVVYDLGYARPAAQPRDLAAVEHASYSLERIREHDADILLTATYATGGHVEAIDVIGPARARR